MTEWKTGRFGTYTLDLGLGVTAGVAWAHTGMTGYEARVMGTAIPHRFDNILHAKEAAQAKLRVILEQALLRLNDLEGRP